MSEEVGLFEAIYTQRAIRRLHPDPVPEEVILKLLEAACKAPNASNLQKWHFVVIRQPEIKAQIGPLYRAAWYEYDRSRASRGVPPLNPRMWESARHLAEHMGEVPVMVLACIESPQPHPGGVVSATRYASVYPAVQNLLLAARGLGLGAAMTTLHKVYENEVKALLEIPEHIETVALIPVGYPMDRYGPTRRRPVHEFTHYEKWGNLKHPDKE